MKLKKIVQKTLCLLSAMLLVAPAAKVKAENNYYTYNYDFFSEVMESPDAYSAQRRIFGK